MVARRLAGYAVATEVARRPEGPEVNGDVRKTVSRRSLVPARERKCRGYSLVLLRKRIKRLVSKRAVYAMSTERINEWKRSEFGQSPDSTRETSYHG